MVVVVGLSTDLVGDGGCCFEVLLRLRTTLQGMSERGKEGMSERGREGMSERGEEGMSERMSERERGNE